MATTEAWPIVGSRTKRLFDLALAGIGLLLCWWLIAICWLLARFDTGDSGIFSQTRIGLHGRPFRVYKIRTMRAATGPATTVTRSGDPRITRLGAILRRAKLDELPQLWNVLRGDMSFVGPRPDVPGFADQLEGEARLMLAIRPGITGPASVAFRDEEAILEAQDDPEAYNRDVIFPEKVRLNLEYIRGWKLTDDLYWILRTIF